MTESDLNTKNENTEIDFKAFVGSLYMSAIVSLGIIPDPITKEKRKNLNFTQETIEILKILKEKTKGNLTEDESKFLDECIYNLMLQYVETAKGAGN
ncbi:MAG: DUF1844 domain-containing protein [Myxococcota bacterium]